MTKIPPNSPSRSGQRIISSSVKNWFNRLSAGQQKVINLKSMNFRMLTLPTTTLKAKALGGLARDLAYYKILDFKTATKCLENKMQIDKKKSEKVFNALIDNLSDLVQIKAGELILEKIKQDATRAFYFDGRKSEIKVKKGIMISSEQQHLIGKLSLKIEELYL